MINPMNHKTHYLYWIVIKFGYKHNQGILHSGMDIEASIGVTGRNKYPYVSVPANWERHSREEDFVFGPKNTFRHTNPLTMPQNHHE